MSAFPQISEAKFEVMKVVWKYAPVSTNEVTEALTRTTDWSPKTIQTLLKRLVTKGALSETEIDELRRLLLKKQGKKGGD